MTYAEKLDQNLIDLKGKIDPDLYNQLLVNLDGTFEQLCNLQKEICADRTEDRQAILNAPLAK